MRKIRKFGDKEQTDNQAKNSAKTETTLILCGSSGEYANSTVGYTYKLDDLQVSITSSKR